MSREVGWEGLEPSTNALKGRCSTIELPTRTPSPAFPFPSLASGMVEKQGPDCLRQCGSGGKKNARAEKDSFLSQDQVQGGERSEGEQYFLKKALVDPVDQESAAQNPHGDEGSQRRVETQRRRGDEPQIHAEGDFEQVHGQKKKGACGDKFEFWQRHRQEEERHDGAGGVGQHGGDARGDPQRPDKPGAVGEVLKCAGPVFSQDVQGGQRKNDEADQRFEPGIAQRAHPKEPNENPYPGGGQHSREHRPADMAAEGVGRQEIAAQEKGQDDAGGFPFVPAHDAGHEDEDQQAHAAKTAFGHTDEKGGQPGKKPLLGSEVGEIHHEEVEK